MINKRYQIKCSNNHSMFRMYPEKFTGTKVTCCNKCNDVIKIHFKKGEIIKLDCITPKQPELPLQTIDVNYLTHIEKRVLILALAKYIASIETVAKYDLQSIDIYNKAINTAQLLISKINHNMILSSPRVNVK